MAKRKNHFNHQEAAIMLVANKIFSDYIEASSIMNVEPEHFVEDWINRHICKPTKFMERSIWRYFLDNLLNYRRMHKK